VESKVGEGSTFIVYLPLESKIQYESPTAEITHLFIMMGSLPHSLQGARILILEDEEHLRLLMERGLNEKGFEAISLEDSQIALERHKEKPFDLILIDLQMPKMSGMDFLAQLKEQAGSDKTPCMIVTGKLDEQNLKQVEDFGISEIIPKPFEMSELNEKIILALIAGKMK